MKGTVLQFFSCLIFAVAVFACGEARAQSVPSIVEVRAGTQANGETRFVLEMSDVLSYQVFVLESPPRLVVVLPTHEWELPRQGRLTLSTLLNSYRHESFASGGGRVVVTSEQPIRVKRSFLLPKEQDRNVRIVVDVEGVGASDIEDGIEEGFLETVPLAPSATPPSSSVPSRASDSVPLPRTRAETTPRQTIPRQTPPRHVVVLDAGHGGPDPGALGVLGTKEKEVVLEFVHELTKQLREHGGYHVVLTREGDMGVGLGSRVLRARESQAALFVSVHADSLKEKHVGGFSVYTLSEVASDREAAALARQENAVDALIGVTLDREEGEVRDILIDLSLRDTKNLSVKFARMLLDRVGEKTPLLSKSHRFAGFRVLKAPDVPSVLVELGFLTNREDESRMVSSAWRRMVARQFVLAMGDFFAVPATE
ncbi:MAG: N-acetylmuramoyl-L-alanine amidase [Hyphomicrobiales bacterium]|nr:N-acetylmuramoyl-L-alanine amidase [Hyphomicrobiales bacterium]MCY4048558.1 N-acetylmuramoyl-L-alanine amidase [Hyphomicrobiales bacterium]MCY4053266.1 N-acetylmuramoyl-L-alanine amidase [Hyphomicrobiales bacterium]